MSLRKPTNPVMGRPRVARWTLLLLAAATSAAVATVSPWLVPVYLLLLGLVLVAPTPKVAPAEVVSVAAVEVVEPPAAEEPLPETAPTPKKARTRSKAKAAPVVAEPPPAQWVRVGPGQFVRVEGVGSVEAPLPAVIEVSEQPEIVIDLGETDPHPNPLPEYREREPEPEPLVEAGSADPHPSPLPESADGEFLAPSPGTPGVDWGEGLGAPGSTDDSFEQDPIHISPRSHFRNLIRGRPAPARPSLYRRHIKNRRPSHPHPSPRARRHTSAPRGPPPGEAR